MDGSEPRLAQLAVLAAAPVVARVVHGLLVLGFLAGEAQPHARYRLAPRVRELRAALGAGLERRPDGQLALGALDRVLHRRVDLFLYRAFLGPTSRHEISPTEMGSGPKMRFGATPQCYFSAASAMGRINAYPSWLGCTSS